MVKLLTPLAAIMFGFGIVVSPELLVSATAVVALFLLPIWLIPISAIVAQHLFPTLGLLPEISGGGVILPSDVLLGLFVARWALERVSRPSDLPLFSEPEFRWLALFLSWAWLGVAMNGSADSVTSLARVSLYLLCFIAAMSKPNIARPLFVALALFAVVQTALGVFGITPRDGTRLLGTYGDPAATGALVLAGIAGTSLLSLRGRILCVPPLLIGWVLSLTRGVWAAGGIEFLLLTFPRIQKSKARLAFVAIVSLGAAYLIVSELTLRLSLNPASLPLRIQSWASGIDLVRQSPFFGHSWGLGSTGLVQGGDPVPYNLWINVAAATGLVGALLLLRFFLAVFQTLARSDGPVPRAALAYLMVLAVLSLTEMTLQPSGTITIEWCLLLGAGLAQAKQNSTLRSDQTRAEAAYSRHPAATGPRASAAGVARPPI